MTELSRDLGVDTAILSRFTNDVLPKVRAIQEKVEQGEHLDDGAIAFLREILEDARSIQPQIELHPEYQEIYVSAVVLYKEIMDKALENEEGHKSQGA